jgi:hypothetical protein
MRETGSYRFEPPFEVWIETTGLDPFEEHVIARVEEEDLRVIGEGLDLEMAIRDLAKKLNNLADRQRFAYRAFHK